MQETHTMQETSVDSRTEEGRKDTTKIYFFLVAIAALLATNVYFYIKYKNSGDTVYELTSGKVNMETEIDRIEAELDRLSGERVALSEALQASRDSVRVGITRLREQLAHNDLTQGQLATAQTEINRLKGEVARYAEEVGNLRNRNTVLRTERDQLREQVSSSADQLATLEEENTDLEAKVRLASALKVSDIQIVGVRERSNGKGSQESRARRVDKLEINFNVVDNPLAELGTHEVYMRVIDPNGNLRMRDNGLFEVDGNQIQYSYKTNIEFSNDGKSYRIDWIDPKGFQRGTYTILLYADNTVMGQSSIVLK
ncbi:hypothetical protein [Parapedobacter lycopersici]|uniref:hypothetical protein n=1 Tax=Parapedobacter lycopersici TaxID=1864939 RepID=UPI00214D6AB5|nr:hypothetical protein [Parapedobacter lycopersici]